MNKNLRIINPKLNIVFAIYLAIIPLIMSIIDLFGPYINMYYHILFWGIAYFVCLFLSVFAFILKGGKINYKLFRNPLVITTTIMLIWIGLTSIINLTFSEELIIYLSYFLIFVCIYNLDNKWGKILLHTLLVVIAISCVMGFIDPYNKFMPGFARGQFNMSLHFSNPNYVAYILTALMLVCFCKFNYSVTLKVSIFYFIIYLVYAVTLFMNGSFVPISVLFLIEILSVEGKKLHAKR